MSLQKLNKITGLEPQKEILEEQHQGPSKTLKETVELLKNIKTELREVEHYIEKGEGSEDGIKQQLEAQLLSIKHEVVQLERMLREALEAEDDGEDVFEAQK